MQNGRRTLLAIASLAVHAGGIAILAVLPSPVRVHGIAPGDPIIVVEWNGDPTQSTTRDPLPQRDREREPATTREPSSTAAAPTSPHPRSRSARARASSPRAEESPPASEAVATPSDDASTTTGDKPSPHALALQGLREHSTARAELPSPRATAGSLPPRAGEHTVPLPDGSPEGPPGDDALPRSLADAGFFRNRKGDWIYQAPGGQFRATLLPDGRIAFKDHMVTATKADGFAPRLPGLPELIRKAQKRELWSHDKAKLARRTFDLRLGIAIAFAERRIDVRLKELYGDLLQIWGATATPAVERRKSIFERWDDCDEAMRVKLPGFEDAEDTRIDALRKSAGARARDKITGFIRRQLPKGSSDAYDDSELEKLNRHRKSRARFAPYDEPAATPE